MSNEITAPKPTKALTLSGMLNDYRVEIARALPKHVSPDRMLRIALTSARKTPELLECSPESFMGAVIQASQLGLEPDTPLGHGWLLPFKNKATGKKEVQFMPGYRGYMDLVYRTPSHPILMPREVYEGDTFVYELGLTPKCEHGPMPHGQNALLTHAYVVATFPDGRKEIWVMSRSEIEAARGRSKAKGFSPWQSDYGPMAMKTCIRRICKYLPMSVELQIAIGLDDLVDAGETQHNDKILSREPIHTKAERVQSKMDPGSFENFKP